MKLIENKFQYPDLQRVENELGRFYLDSKGQEVPSVTNVLSSTSTSVKSHLPNSGTTGNFTSGSLDLVSEASSLLISLSSAI